MLSIDHSSRYKLKVYIYYNSRQRETIYDKIFFNESQKSEQNLEQQFCWILAQNKLPLSLLLLLFINYYY